MILRKKMKIQAMIKLRLFMKLADTIGCMQNKMTLPEMRVDMSSTLIIFDKLFARFRLAPGDDTKVQIIINNIYADITLPVMDADEIAFFPLGCQGGI
jgi:hypothetical protein